MLARPAQGRKGARGYAGEARPVTVASLRLAKYAGEK